MAPVGHVPDQRRALVHAFLARFFENEITSGTDDLKRSLFGLLSFLAVPGLFIPIMMSFSYVMVARIYGIGALRELSRADKTFYLGYAMIASAALTAVTWQSLLVDRRDGLILGALPVRSSTIMASKVAALAAYIGLVATAMHVMASLSYGVFLSVGNTFGFMLRGIAAHFLASAAMSVFIFFAAVAAQGLILLVVGPRVFARVSSALHAAFVILIVIAVLALPAIAISVVDTLRGTGKHVAPWVLLTPPAWFLGLYECILGTDNPVLLRLARTASLLFGAVVAATFICYPIACRRLISAGIEGRAEARGSGWSTRFASALTFATGRHHHIRAVSQFFLTSLGRVDRLRVVLAAGLGVAIAWGVPGWLSLRSALPPSPTTELLSLSLSTMLFLLAALRVAAAIPTDLKAGWIFEASALDRRHARAAVERTLVALGVLPPVLVFAPVYWWLWGADAAASHAAISVAVGILLTESLLWGFDVVPCSRRWNPESLNLGRWWPLYVGIFILFTGKIPSIELLLLGHPVATGLFTLFVVLVAGLVRYRSSQQPPTPDEESTAVTVPSVLGLD